MANFATTSLYYCSASTCQMPDSVTQLHYSLCAVHFDAATKTFGSVVDTIFNAHLEEKSVSFPRVSPDGRFLVVTVSSYGMFPIWHHDADLYIINLETGEGRYLDVSNSLYADSYHSWSSNSRWLVFAAAGWMGFIRCLDLY